MTQDNRNITEDNKTKNWAAANTGLLLQRLDEQFESSVVSSTFVSWDSGRNTKPLQQYAPKTLAATLKNRQDNLQTDEIQF